LDILSFILALAGGIAALLAILFKIFKCLKKYRMPLVVFASIAGITVIILQFMSAEKPVARDEMSEIVSEAVSKAVEPLVCTIDTLKATIEELAQSDSVGPEQLAALDSLAMCTEKADPPLSELDSAVIAIGLGEYDEALSLLDAARVEEQGDSAVIAETFFYSGVASYFKGDYLSAIASYDSSIVYKHDAHEAWNNRGNALRELDRHEEAISSYDSAIAYKHHFHEAWNNRGVALGELGRLEEAIASFDSAIVYKHDKHEAWYNQGIALGKLGRLEEAIASYDSAIAYKHDFQDAWYNRGLDLGKVDGFEEAITSFDSAIFYKHNDHEAWYNRGIALDELGRLEDAAASFDSAEVYKR
jgi:tetratricopeptide (TPR) repeat protein